MRYYQIPDIEDEKTYLLYCMMIRKSNHETNKAKIKVNSFVQELKFSRQNIATCMKRLENEGLIEKTSSNNFSTIEFLEFNKSTEKKTVKRQVKPKEAKQDFSQEFEEFWGLYQKKQGKGKCEQKYSDILSKDKKLHNEIITKVKEYNNYIKATSSQDFVKNPYTWLNQKCWNDEYKVNTIGNGIYRVNAGEPLKGGW